jgi:hypothetical protein
MKKKCFTILTVLVGLGMVAGFGGCASNSREFRIQSEFDAAIAGAVTQTLTNYENAYNKQDLAGILPNFNKDGQIVSEGGIKLFSREQFFKKEFAEVFPETFRRFPTMALGSPEAFMILPSKDKAVLDVMTTLGEIKVWTKVSMIMDGDRWLIMKILYRTEKRHT